MDQGVDLFQYFPAKQAALKRNPILKHETTRSSLDSKEIPHITDIKDIDTNQVIECFTLNKSRYSSNQNFLYYLNIAEKSMAMSEVPLKNQCDIEHFSPMTDDILQVKKENKILEEELAQMEEEFQYITKCYNVEIQQDASIEKELQFKHDKDKQKYNECIKTLENRLEYLNKVSKIFKECFFIEVKQENGKFICSTFKDNQEITFGFTINNYYTTYTPIKVNFPQGNFLNYKIEDMNRTELCLLFTRLLKLIYNS